MRSDMTREQLIDDTIKLVNGEKGGWRWLQGRWLKRTDCGTSACVAGNTVLAAGYLPAKIKTREGAETVSEVLFMRPRGTNAYSVHSLAGNLLGLTIAESNYLFNSSRSKKAVLACLKLLKEGKRVSDYNGYKRSCPQGSLQLSSARPANLEHFGCRSAKPATGDWRVRG